MMNNGHMMDMKVANKGSRKVAHKKMGMVSNASSQVPTEKTPQTGIGTGKCETHKMGSMI